MTLRAPDTRLTHARTATHSAKRVLKAESEALLKVSDTLGEEFDRAISFLMSCDGRIIVSGMGKSGHIGCKIAATLSSTGSPAFFVHPAEASHGDLGMVTERDVVILLSNSGETHELNDILAYAKRFGIVLIGITGKQNSTLAKATHVALILPELTEACPMGLAPTTSTTAMLALGDCLAVALLEQRGFTANDFHIFHPGGKLGAGLKRVCDVMHGLATLPTCTADTTMGNALIIMSEHSFGIVGIVDETGILIGVITDGDLRRHMSADLLTKTANAVMSKTPQTVAPLALLGDALYLMNTHNIGCLFVVDETKVPVGIIRILDCLDAGVA